jgi:hypothetical protein
VRAYSLASGISAASEVICVQSFTIVASAGEGGTISPHGNVTVSYGGKQTFTFTPDKDYEIAGVVVDGTNAGAAKNNYTFSNVKENHTIAVTFQKKLEIKTVAATPPRLSVYPNPTKGEIQIKNRSKIGSIQVFDVIGKLRREINNINDTETIVDLSSFPKGIYILKMDGETIKVIKQ